ncbi:MAG TPA: hypothetical protein DDW17_03575 [Deltaproteobacteria bacterium]|nr:hypothetical protein [Deltaproteobacteria bacterium]
MAFKDVVGHEKQKYFLKRFLDTGRTPHALLFSGQEGIGKKKLAIEFIKYMFCERGDGCGKCRACLKIERRTHPDVIFIEEEDTIGIDLVRGNREKKITGINEEIHEYPYEGTNRAILIDRADTMTQEASNALLKTLEEPPTFNHFFLITSSEQKIPLTIRSRCTRVRFTSLIQGDLQQYFVEVQGMDDEKANFFSTISCGSIGTGLFWLEEENFSMRKKLAALVVGKDRSFLHTTLVSEMVSQSDLQMSMYLNFLISLFRDLYMVHYGQDPSRIINRDVKEILKCENVDTEWIISSIERIQEGIHLMRYNVNRWLLFENTMLHIMRL